MGFGGLRDLGELLTFNPRLPDSLVRLAFSIRHRGRCLRVDVTGKSASYVLTRGDGQILVKHHGEELSVGREPVTRPIPPGVERPAPKQPAGREPRHRRPE